MSFDFKQLEGFRTALLDMKKEAPKIMEELAVGEGVYAVGQAKRICKDEKIVDTGAYRMNWHTGNKATQTGASETAHDGAPPRQSGTSYQIDIYNNLDSAKHLEYGFRSHFVPAKYLAASFLNRYQKSVNKTRKSKGLKRSKKPITGIYVGKPGGYVKGRYVLKRAIKRTETTQPARLSRKWNGKVKQYLEGRRYSDGE